MDQYFTIKTESGLVATLRYKGWDYYLSHNEGCIVPGTKHRVKFVTTLYDADNWNHAIDKGIHRVDWYENIGENIKWPIKI